MIYNNRIDCDCADIVERFAIINDVPITPLGQISAACIDAFRTLNIAIYRLKDVALNRKALNEMPRTIGATTNQEKSDRELSDMKNLPEIVSPPNENWLAKSRKASCSLVISI